MNVNYLLLYMSVNQLNVVLSLQQNDISTPLKSNTLLAETLVQIVAERRPVRSKVREAYQNPTNMNVKQVKQIATKRVRKIYAKNKLKNIGHVATQNVSLPVVTMNSSMANKRRKRQVHPSFQSKHSSRQTFYIAQPQQQPQPQPSTKGFQFSVPQPQQQQLSYPQRPVSYQNGNNIIDTRLNPWHFHITLVSPNPEPLPAYHDLLEMARQFGPFNYGRPNFSPLPGLFS